MSHMYFLSQQAENTFLFPVWLHVATEQTVLHRTFIPCLAAPLKFHLSEHQGLHTFHGGKGMCCTTELETDLRSLHVADRKLFSSWQCGRKGDGPGRTINREEFKLECSERGGGGTC